MRVLCESTKVRGLDCGPWRPQDHRLLRLPYPNCSRHRATSAAQYLRRNGACPHTSLTEVPTWTRTRSSWGLGRSARGRARHGGRATRDADHLARGALAPAERVRVSAPRPHAPDASLGPLAYGSQSCWVFARLSETVHRAQSVVMSTVSTTTVEGDATWAVGSLRDCHL